MIDFIYLILKKYYFDDFECDETKDDHLNREEFIAFWRRILNIFFELDKNGGKTNQKC